MPYRKAPDGSLGTEARKFPLRVSPIKRTDDNSDDMNLDGSPTQSELIWDGSATAWTRTGGVQNGASNRPGSPGDGINTQLTATPGEEVSLTRSSAFDPTSGHDAVAFWIDPQQYPAGANLTIHWENGGALNGLVLNVEDYTRSLSPSRPYRQIVIPIGDFGTTGNADELVFTMADVAGQRFRLDDLEMVTGPKIFRLDGPASELRHVKDIRLVLAAPNTGWASTGFANRTALDSGLLVQHRRLSTGKVFWKLAVRDNIDLLGRFSMISDGVFPGTPDERIMSFIYVIPPSVTDVNDDCVIDILVRDDLGGLNALEAFSSFEKEDVTP